MRAEPPEFDDVVIGCSGKVRVWGVGKAIVQEVRSRFLVSWPLSNGSVFIDGSSRMDVALRKAYQNRSGQPWEEARRRSLRIRFD